MTVKDLDGLVGFPQIDLTVVPQVSVVVKGGYPSSVMAYDSPAYNTEIQYCVSKYSGGRLLSHLSSVSLGNDPGTIFDLSRGLM